MWAALKAAWRDWWDRDVCGLCGTTGCLEENEILCWWAGLPESEGPRV